MSTQKRFSVYSNVLNAVKKECHGNTEALLHIPKQDTFKILHDLATTELSHYGEVSRDAAHKVACHVYGSL